MEKKQEQSSSRSRVVIFRSNPIAPDPRVEKIAFGLSKVHAVHVVGWDRTGKYPAQKTYAHFSLELYSKVSKYGSGIKNLFDLISWQFFLLRWVMRHGGAYHVIHACDFDTVLPALFGKFIFQNKVVYDIFDFYADHIRNTPGWIKRIIRWLDYRAVRRADAVILVTEAQLSQLEGSIPARLIIVYNTPVDTPGEEMVQRDPAYDLRVAYIGILQQERGLMEMLEVMSNHPNWHFDLAGFGGDEPVIVSEAQELPNVTWHGRIPYDQTIRLSRSADVLFSICDPQVPNYRHASANKLFEAMMLAKPIIVARGMNQALIVEKYQCGLVVNYGDVNELEQALERLANDEDLRSRLGINGRRMYESTYSWEKMEERLLNLYASL